MATPKSIVVLGGSGFVGRSICREAVRRGWRVTSLTRHGAPPNVAQDGLLKGVEWRTGSALDAAVYDELLAGKDYLVHSIGILFESNPLYNLYKSQPVEYSASYRALIRDTAELAVAAAERLGIRCFGYVSAARYGALGSALLPEYMQRKAEAEELIRRTRRSMGAVIVRPGFMYGSDRWATIPISLGVSAMSLFTAGLLPRSLCVETVARALLNQISALEDGGAASAAADTGPSTDPVVLEVDDIARLGA